MNETEPSPDASGDARCVVTGSCSECGGPFEAGIWDRSHACDFCGSLLIFPVERERVYAIGNADAFAVLDVFLWDELRRHRAEVLAGYKIPDGPSFEIPGLVDAQVARREAEIRAQFELLEEIDFYVPYHIRNETIWQGVLGRRKAAKESFAQVFQSQEIERGYDPARWALRDLGLKIHAFRLEPIRPEDLERADGRFLPLDVGRAEHAGVLDRSRVRLREDQQIVCRFAEAAPAGNLVVYKNLVFARIALADGERALLIDRQFGTIAARLGPDEHDAFRSIPRQVPDALVHPPDVVVAGSECPDCGAELHPAESEHIRPCTACLRAVAVSAKGLETIPCLWEPPPPRAAGVEYLYLPFWAFPFSVETQAGSFENLWSWLEQVSPHQRVRALSENDPAQSRLFVPARALYGSPALDRAGNLASGFAGWRQPTLSRDRPTPRDDLRFLGADVELREAAAVRRFALLALHDASSTRRLNGLNFRQMIAEARLPDAATVTAELAMIALPIRDGAFALEGHGAFVECKVLELDRQARRITKTYGLR